MKQIRKRLTYANAMSSIAVFLVIGGATAFAALGKNTVGTKQLKKNAVTKAKIKNGAVTTSKLANDAATGEKVNESTLGTVPDAAKLGGLAPTSYQGRIQWAIVNSNGTEILRQSGGISLTGHSGGSGIYGIRFPVSTQNAAIQVTPTISGFAGSIAGTTDAKAGPCPDSPDCAGVEGTTTNDAVVAVFRAGALADQGFFISLVP
ncbi:MAG TPA: hypothetical protein VNL97_04865 [Solirubrobacterales bacterium]|nr:hypothetical protein [Solirubrobacterales bacterium]